MNQQSWIQSVVEQVVFDGCEDSLGNISTEKPTWVEDEYSVDHDMYFLYQLLKYLVVQQKSKWRCNTIKNHTTYQFFIASRSQPLRL